MSPITLSETLIHCFTFVGPDGYLKQGMRNEGKLYVYVASFPIACQGQAYALSYGLSEYHQQVVVTHSENGYNVWKELRSLHQAPSTKPAMLSV